MKGRRVEAWKDELTRETVVEIRISAREAQRLKPKRAWTKTMNSALTLLRRRKIYPNWPKAQ